MAGHYIKTEEHKRKIGLKNAISLRERKLSKTHVDNIRLATIKRIKENGFGFQKGHNPSKKWYEMMKKRMGKNAPNWRGGKTKKNDKIRKSLEYKMWRTSVFTRDNFTCVWGGKEHGSKLEADHIKPFALYPELRFAIDNGRTLCKDCHKSTKTYLNSFGKNQYTKGFIIED